MEPETDNGTVQSARIIKMPQTSTLPHKMCIGCIFLDKTYGLHTSHCAHRRKPTKARGCPIGKWKPEKKVKKE